MLVTWSTLSCTKAIFKVEKWPAGHWASLHFWIILVGSFSSTNDPVTLPPNSSNLPPGWGPSKRSGLLLVKAVIRPGSVKVAYNSAAVVRNSVDSVSVVTFTFSPVLAACVVVELELLPLVMCVWETYLGVENPLEGFEPGACWMSFACSRIRAGARPDRCFRRRGTSFLRATSLIAASFGNSELRSTSNWVYG